MSLIAMGAVWQNFSRGGSEKLTLLALADWCDDDGKSLYPSIQRIAKKISASESQARRIVHGFIEEGLLSVVGNHNGGAKGATRQYHLHLERLASTPGTHATPSMDATP
ncbi:helix-turn-helix domain-containing protein, partial [Herbaspirillum chlorophenolicum]